MTYSIDEIFEDEPLPELRPPMWYPSEAIEFCKKVEAIIAPIGHHVALTGGCLYKEGCRKDLDLIIYSVRQSQLNQNEVFELLQRELMLEVLKWGNWQSKFRTMDGYLIDILIPEMPRFGSDSYE